MNSSESGVYFEKKKSKKGEVFRSTFMTIQINFKLLVLIKFLFCDFFSVGICICVLYFNFRSERPYGIMLTITRKNI